LIRALPTQPFLYPIIDAGLCRKRGIDPLTLCDAYLAGGARVLQLREKERASAAFLELADVLVRRAISADALLIINDRADIARIAGAAGVHVGQDDLASEAVRRILPDGAIVGVSTHTPWQLDAALAAPVDYIAIGPVFATASKATGYEPIGLAGVSSAARACAARGVPLVAIGGITLGTARDVLDAGAASVAVISDLLTGDPEARVRAYLSLSQP